MHTRRAASRPLVRWRSQGRFSRRHPSRRKSH